MRAKHKVSRTPNRVSGAWFPSLTIREQPPVHYSPQVAGFPAIPKLITTTAAGTLSPCYCLVQGQSHGNRHDLVEIWWFNGRGMIRQGSIRQGSAGVSRRALSRRAFLRALGVSGGALALGGCASLGAVETAQ